MGLMRKVQTRAMSAASAGSEAAQSREAPRDRSKRGAAFYVQPAELARKLVKEMEDHKVSYQSRVSVCNRYTVYLCPADHERMMDRQGSIVAKLQRHLVKHAHSRRYEMSAEIEVFVTRDDDLALGRFGILAESTGPSQRDASAEEISGAGICRNGTQQREAPAPGMLPRTVHRNPAGGATRVIKPAEAAQLGLARQIIVVRAGNHVGEFNHGRVIVGRGRDADFRVDGQNVSRRHAAIYWADGRIMVEDLGSTNGTMVNGYPVTSMVLRPNDVLIVGDCRITVETR